MELLDPVQGVGDQERLHLVAPVVEDVGAPLLVLALARVGMLVERRAVEAAQRPVVLGEVAGHPVQDHPDPGLVQPVDQVAQLVGATQARHRGEVVGDLVAPRGLERVFGDRHELDMREAHPGHVLHELLSQVQVGASLAPRAQMHLVDRGRGLVRHMRGAPGHPLVIAPDVPALVHDRGVRRGPFSEPGHRVDLLVPHIVGTQDVVLVQGALPDPFDEQRPHPGPRDQGHGVPGPPVEVSVHPDRSRVRRPHREPGAPYLAPLVVGHRDHMRPQASPALRVATVVESLKIPTSQTTCHVMGHGCFLSGSTERCHLTGGLPWWLLTSILHRGVRIVRPGALLATRRPTST